MIIRPVKSTAQAFLREMVPITRPSHPMHESVQRVRKVAYRRDGRPGYFSQNGQDRFVEQLLQGRRDGVFLDIGAYDGISYSNSYHFEQELGWTGMCIEPHPRAFRELQQNRSCICIHGAIAPREGQATFLEVSGTGAMLSGLIETHASASRAKEYGHSKGCTLREIEVPCFRVESLLEQHEINHIDYVSIDTEGGELEILKTIDLNGLGVEAISIENNYDDNRIEWYLHRRGYRLKGILGSDEIFQRI